MAQPLRSPWLPLIGIILLWGAYAGFRAMRPLVLLTASGAMASLRSEAPPAARPRPGSVRRAARADLPATKTPAPEAATFAEEHSAGDPSMADDGILAFLEGFRPSDEGALDRLRRFVDEHPDDEIARGMLILFLIQAKSDEGPWDEAEVRGHVAKLRELLPEQGFPDLLLARVESMAGNLGAARERLLEAAGKDLSWFPEVEAMHRRVAADLEKGLPVSKVMSRMFGTLIPSLMEMRHMADDVLPRDKEDEEGNYKRPAPPSDPEALDLHRRTARALLQVGKSMEDSPFPLIHNLVGAALVDISCRSLEDSGSLESGEAALRERRKVISAEASLVSGLGPELLFSDPGAGQAYLADLLDRGEGRALLRAAMVFLARRTAE
jgi:hypothetical protein